MELNLILDPTVLDAARASLPSFMDVVPNYMAWVLVILTETPAVIPMETQELCHAALVGFEEMRREFAREHSLRVPLVACVQTLMEAM